jgi:hypothetical protein
MQTVVQPPESNKSKRPAWVHIIMMTALPACFQLIPCVQLSE